MLIILLVHKKSGAISWNNVELAAFVSGVEHLCEALKSSIRNTCTTQVPQGMQKLCIRTSYRKMHSTYSKLTPSTQEPAAAGRRAGGAAARQVHRAGVPRGRPAAHELDHHGNPEALHRAAEGPRRPIRPGLVRRTPGQSCQNIYNMGSVNFDFSHRFIHHH